MEWSEEIIMMKEMSDEEFNYYHKIRFGGLSDTIVKILICAGIFMLIAFCAQAQTIPQDLREQREYTVKRFAEVTRGTPLSTPLIFESDPGWYLLIVSTDSVNKKIDRVFLVDATNLTNFKFQENIYNLDSVLICHTYDKAMVTGLKNGIAKEVVISGYQQSIIRKINRGQWEGYSCTIKIPIIKEDD